MNSQTYNTLESDSAEALQSAFGQFSQQQAVSVIHQQLENLKEKGQVLILSDEEERLLASFRRFKVSCKPGGVFKWQTRPDPAGVVLAEDTGLVTDPQDVSA